MEGSIAKPGKRQRVGILAVFLVLKQNDRTSVVAE